jgi:hypothetical protein
VNGSEDNAGKGESSRHELFGLLNQLGNDTASIACEMRAGPADPDYGL